MKKTTFLKSLLLAAALTTGASAWAEVYQGTTANYEVLFGSPVYTDGVITGVTPATEFTTDNSEQTYSTMSLQISGSCLAGNQEEGRTYSFTDAPETGKVYFKANGKFVGGTYNFFSIKGSVTNSENKVIESYDIVQSPYELPRNSGGTTVLRIFGQNITASYVYTPRDVVYGFDVTIDLVNQKVDYVVTYASKGSSGTVSALSTINGSVPVPDGYTLNSVSSWFIPKSGGANFYDNVTFYSEVPNVALYSATFTETNGLNPTVTIYTDSNMDEEISNGFLPNGTYFYKAVLTGYYDKTGSFIVSNNNPSVSFTMDVIPVYSYTVNAVDAENGIIKSAIVSGTCHANESTSFYLPTCVLVNGTLYFMTAESSYKEETIEENNQVFSYPYTTSTVDNVVYFVEGENITGASESTNNYKHLASNGKMGRGSDLNVTTLPAGAYTVYVKYINTNSGEHTLIVKAGDTDVINVTDVKARPTKSGSVTLTEPTAITLTAPGSSTSGVDYLYIVKTGDVANITATITAAGWATLYTDKALDFSDVEGLTAYTATCSNNEVTLTEVNDVPANTGVVLKGAAATYNIPAIASSTTEPGDLQGSTTQATAYNAYEGFTLYMLNIVEGKAQFVPVTSDEIAAGKAFLKVSNAAGIRSLKVVFGGEATGINAVNAQQATEEFYNLRGQRVAAPQKGLYIVNGKKVVLK